MKKIVFIIFLALPVLGKAQKDTSTATKEETVDWIASKLQDFCRGDYETTFYRVNNPKIAHVKKVYFHVQRGYGQYNKDEISYIEEAPEAAMQHDENGDYKVTLTKTTTFNLNDIDTCIINEYGMMFYCRDNKKCIITTSNTDTPNNYSDTLFIGSINLNESLVNRLETAFEHLKYLNSLNKPKEKF